MNARLKAVPRRQPEPLRYPIGGAALENHARTVYQSTNSTKGRAAPLPYTLAQAWAEVVREGLV